MAKDNRTIGKFHLSDLPPAPRGVPQIEVTFDIDANGIISVSAKDKGTGKEQKIRIESSSGLSKEEIEKMKRDAEANAESDKKAKETVEKLNLADNLIFQTEKSLKEYGDKISADKKAEIETALNLVKEAHKAQDIPALDGAMEKLNTLFSAVSQEMYNNSNTTNTTDQTSDDNKDQNKKGDSEVTDVDYEEVK